MALSGRQACPLCMCLFFLILLPLKLQLQHLFNVTLELFFICFVYSIFFSLESSYVRLKGSKAQTKQSRDSEAERRYI